MSLILASQSTYRRALLARLGLPFQCEAPAIAEYSKGAEKPAAMAARLAREKADAVSRRFPHALVIGSDQVAVVEGRPLGKPGSHAGALRQLALSSGRTVQFHTGVALQRASDGWFSEHTETCSVVFRHLNMEEIESYLRREQPYDCAGSFKCEGLGIALFERIESGDPTALEGLPLISLCRMLREAGCRVL